MKRSFNLWLLSFLLQAITIVISGYFGFFKLLYTYDHTFLGFAAIVGFFAFSIAAGMKAYNEQPTEDWQWFIGENFMNFGLLGTAIGLAIVMSSLQGFQATDLESVKTVIMSVALGMASALYTTICAIAVSSFAKIQLVIVDKWAKPDSNLEQFGILAEGK